MKKKIYFLLIATIITLFATSCSKEEPESQGDVAEVTFDLGLENAIATRAISDGTGANKLVFAVFNETTHEVVVPKVERIISNKLLLEDEGYEVKVTLVKGETYRACFWAQNSKCTAYTISEDMKVTIDYKGDNNDELRDAFFGVSSAFDVDTTNSETVYLRRPFAQINVGAYEYDYTYAVQEGLNVTLSGATIKGVPTQINLFDGTTTGSADVNVDVQYALSAIPSGDNEKLYVDVDENGVKESYRYLSMSYILSTTEGTTHEMSFQFRDVERDKLVGFSEGLTHVPAKRNWRTNIVGQILTGPANFKIIIDPTYEGEYIHP